jgi:hypothetical protein
MCYAVVNPVLTIAFDLFLIGSAAGVIAGMVAEYFRGRRPVIGTPAPGTFVVPQPLRAARRNPGETPYRHVIARRPARRLRQMTVGG